MINVASVSIAATFNCSRKNDAWRVIREDDGGRLWIGSQQVPATFSLLEGLDSASPVTDAQWRKATAAVVQAARVRAEEGSLGVHANAHVKALQLADEAALERAQKAELAEGKRLVSSLGSQANKKAVLASAKGLSISQVKTWWPRAADVQLGLLRLNLEDLRVFVALQLRRAEGGPGVATPVYQPAPVDSNKRLLQRGISTQDAISWVRQIAADPVRHANMESLWKPDAMLVCMSYTRGWKFTGARD